MRHVDSANIPYKLLGQIGPDSPLRGLSKSDDADVTKELTTVYINVMYYSALSNLYLQSMLPGDIAEVDAQMPRVKIAVERTYADFAAAAAWLSRVDKEAIGASPAKSYYDEVSDLEAGAIKNIEAVYARKAR